MDHITKGGGTRTMARHSDVELRKVFACVQRGETIHPRLGALLVHFGYLTRQSSRLMLTLKGHRLMRH